MSLPSPCTLITGGNGNIGRLVADRLLARGERVLKYDIGEPPPAALRDGEIVELGDVRDTERLAALIESHRPVRIIHLASLLSGSSEQDIGAAWEINATASFQLMRLAVENGVGQFFFASTAATYGPVDQNPMPLDFAQWPESLYGATKVAVERAGLYFKSRHDLDFRCIRYPLVVSPYAPKTAVSAYPSLAIRAAFAGDAFRFPVAAGTGVSSMFLQDVIDSVIQMIDADRARLSQPVYNIHAYHLTTEQVIETLLKHFADFDFGYDVIDTVDRLISQWPDVIDDRDARRDWGWQPKFDFEQSAESMLAMLEAESQEQDN